MADLLKVAKELIGVAADLRDRFGIYYAEGELYDFDQTWGSTALGFGCIGGQAITKARTYVFIPYEEERAYVYFGGIFAYKVPINNRFREDLMRRNMASVVGSGVYKKKDEGNNDAG